MSNEKASLAVRAISATYAIHGPDLERVLSQAELSRACGYSSQTRVCRIVAADRFLMSSAALRRLVKGLRAIGADVSGLVPGIDEEVPSGS